MELVGLVRYNESMTYTPGIHKPIPAPTPEMLQRFISQVDSTQSCWKWIGFVNKDGYGQISLNKQSYKAHRVAYEWMVGLIPQGMVLDHICRTRECINPKHLEPLPAAINGQRSGGIKTHCKNGHEYTEENTYTWRGYRNCRACQKIASKAASIRRKEKI